MRKQAFPKSRLILFLIFYFTLSIANSLQFNENGEFTIVQFTDLHFCVNKTNDKLTRELQRKIIEQFNPDFVAISGDGISGGGSHQHPKGFETCWEYMLQPIMEAQIPYGYTLGNHDGEGNLDRFQIAKLDQTHPLSVRRESEGIPGTLNFVVPVYSSKDDSKLAANIWMLDTGYVGCDGLENSWGCLEKYQLDWYDNQSKKIAEEHGKDVHHLAFIHIPIPEYRELYNSNKFYGNIKEGIGCSYVNTGFFNRILKNGDISGIFCGHDHSNTMGGFYKGIELAYGQKSGYHGSGNHRGARIIKLKENYTPEGKLYVTRQHFIIREDGEIIDTETTMHRYRPRQENCQYPAGPDSQRMIKFKKLLWDIKNYINPTIKNR